MLHLMQVYGFVLNAHTSQIECMKDLYILIELIYIKFIIKFCVHAHLLISVSYICPQNIYQKLNGNWIRYNVSTILIPRHIKRVQ